MTASKNNDLRFVKVDILENWRFWNKYQKNADYEGAGREVIAQANAMLAQDMESNDRAALLLQEGLDFKKKKSEAGKKGGAASVSARRLNTKSDKSGRVRIPLPSWEAFLQFVDDNDLDYAWSRQWWEMTMNDRNGKDRDGKPIDDWQACLIAFINAKKRGVSK